MKRKSLYILLATAILFTLACTVSGGTLKQDATNTPTATEGRIDGRLIRSTQIAPHVSTINTPRPYWTPNE